MLEQILGILEDVRETIAGWLGGVWERVENVVENVVEEVRELLGIRAEEDLAEAVEEFSEEVDAWQTWEEEDLERLQGEAEELERVREEIEELTEGWEGWEEEWEEEEWADLEQALGELEEAERELEEVTEEGWEKMRMMEEWGTDEEGIELLYYTLSPNVPGGSGWRLRGTFTFPEAIAYVEDLPDWMPQSGYVAVVIVGEGIAEVWVKESSKSKRRRR
jgi:uncharacterized protein YukE